MSNSNRDRGSDMAALIDAAEQNSPLDRLRSDPSRFDFFQAVYLLSAALNPRRSGDRHDMPSRPRPLETPFDEHVRFRTLIGHSFPSATIASLDLAAEPPDDDQRRPPEMSVTFLGLAGIGGILPAHYTQMLIDRVKEKDFSLRDFLDLFNHRFVAQFWRAWARNRFHVAYDLARRQGPSVDDIFTFGLYSLAGLGTPGLRRRQSIADDVWLFYSGHFAHFPRSAVALRLMIRDFFDVPVEIRQFQGQWMYLQRDDMTRIGAFNHQLGVTAVAGERVWGVENKFRIRLGVLRYRQFCHYLPGSQGFRELGQLTRSYAGPAWDFDVQLVLDRNEIPPCSLAEGSGIQLGWNSWLTSRPMERDPDEAVFACDGNPDR